MSYLGFKDIICR